MLYNGVVNLDSRMALHRHRSKRDAGYQVRAKQGSGKAGLGYQPRHDCFSSDVLLCHQEKNFLMYDPEYYCTVSIGPALGRELRRNFKLRDLLLMTSDGSLTWSHMSYHHGSERLSRP